MSEHEEIDACMKWRSGGWVFTRSVKENASKSSSRARSKWGGNEPSLYVGLSKKILVHPTADSNEFINGVQMHLYVALYQGERRI